MSNQKSKKLMDSESEQQSEEVIEVAIKKTPQNIPKVKLPVKAKKIQKKIQKKQSQPKLKEQLRNLLKQKIQDQKLLKQLQKGPLNFGDQANNNNRKILLIEQKVKTQKKQKKLGLNLVFQKKALPRKGSNRLSSVLAKCNHLRGNMDVINRGKNTK